MKHQPFENWLLFDEPLSQEQARSLDEHLQSCEHCRELRAAWENVESLFESSSQVEPLSGFATRWQACLKQERHRELLSRHQWQSWITLILIANVVSLIAVLLGLQFFNTFDSLTELLLVGVYRLTSLLTVLNLFKNIVAVFMRVLPGLLSPSGWAILAVMVSVGSLFWVFSMVRISRMPRRA